MNGCVVITPEQIYSGEDEVINIITAVGSRVHIRKPQHSGYELCSYIEKTAHKSQLSNITLHRNLDIAKEFNLGGYHVPYSEISTIPTIINMSISCSTHSISEAKVAENSNLEYYFLSPIFDSISKQGYKSNFERDELNSFLSTADKKCVALGGVDYDKLHLLTDFNSIALLGAVWVIENNKINVSKSIKQFEKIDKLWRELKECNI